MEIIGVIDVKDGQAVHARGGRREAYAAVSNVAGTAINGDPVRLARLYLETFGIHDIYIADLDAITSRPPQYDVIRAVSRLGVRVCADSGVTTREDARELVRAGANTVVVGLETLPSFETLMDIRDNAAASTMFSLDLRDGVPMGSLAADSSPEQVAQRLRGRGVAEIIVLDVGRVGSGRGPDVEMLWRIMKAITPAQRLFAGGGIRNIEDLRLLAAMGCDGALVATALHDGRLTPVDVAGARALRVAGTRCCSPVFPRSDS